MSPVVPLCQIQAKSTLNSSLPWMSHDKWNPGCDRYKIIYIFYLFVSTLLRKQYQPICELLTGHDVIVVSRCFCAFLVWLQPLLQHAAPALKALTCACCLLAADVIVRDKYSVFVGTVSLSVWRRLDLATCVSCPEEKNLCTCLCLCRLSRGKKKKKKTSGGICGVICQDEIKSSGCAEAVVPVETDYPAFIAHVGSAGRRGETCKWEWKRGRRLVWITPILFQQNIIWRLLLPPF